MFFAFFAFQHVVSEKFTRAERFQICNQLYHRQRTSVQKEWITNLTIFHVIYSSFTPFLVVLYACFTAQDNYLGTNLDLKVTLISLRMLKYSL